MKVLLVEDEVKLGRAIKTGLEQDGYAVDLLHTAEQGLSYAETENYDVLIFDRMLPGGQDGLDIIKAIRSQGDTTPALLLTAKGEIEDKISGLDNGADDYLVKPFSFDELTARIRALVRRPRNAVATIIKNGPLEINTSTKQVLISDRLIKLSRKEYALLEYLAHNSGQVISKDQLIEHVWNFDADILPNTVEVFIRGIRKKLDKDSSIIETIRGFGYRLREN